MTPAVYIAVGFFASAPVVALAVLALVWAVGVELKRAVLR